MNNKCSVIFVIFLAKLVMSGDFIDIHVDDLFF